jgi:hypothetical protein
MSFEDDVEQSQIAGACLSVRLLAADLTRLGLTPAWLDLTGLWHGGRAALPMLSLDPGAGRAEMVGLKHADVDLDVDVLLVLGQGLP